MMKKSILGLLMLMLFTSNSFAQNASGAEQEIIALSKQKWQWMADKDVDKLTPLFDDKSVFVHMGGSWAKHKKST